MFPLAARFAAAAERVGVVAVAAAAVAGDDVVDAPPVGFAVDVAERDEPVVVAGDGEHADSFEAEDAEVAVSHDAPGYAVKPSQNNKFQVG